MDYEDKKKSLYFPGEPWTNMTMAPFEPNTMYGSLTVNFGAKSISGFANKMEDDLGLVCESCVIEIPQCPNICERCDEGTTTTMMPTTTEYEPRNCEQIRGHLGIEFT